MTGRASLVAFAADLCRFAGRRGAAALIAMLAGAVAEGVGLAVLLPLLALVLTPARAGPGALVDRALGWTGVEGQLALLALVLGAFVVAMLARALVLTWRDRVLMSLQIDFVAALRARLLTALAQVRWSDIATIRHARIAQALGEDLERCGAATHTVLQIAAMTAMLATQWLLVLLISPRLAAAMLLLIAMAALVFLPSLRRVGRAGFGLATGRLGAAHGTAQLLGGLKSALAEGTQSLFTAQLARLGAEQSAKRLDFLRRTGRSRIVAATGLGVTGALVIFAGVWLGSSPVALLATLAIFLRMAGPALTMQHNAQTLTDQLPAHAALAELVGELRRNEVLSTQTRTLPRRAEIRLQEIGYRHQQGAGVDGISLTLSPGEMIAVIGPSGAGKTTLVDLLAGLLRPQTGSITIGGVALDGTTLADWRTHIAYVGQDSFLRHDTVRANLLAGAAVMEEEAIADALAIAGADDLLAGLPDGLETVVAERGARLSGGQRQRIALARALLRRPDLLILDEATNALDPAAEQAVLARLAALRPRPLIVIVAHRPAPQAACDRAITLEDGRIASDTLRG
ncbi:MAG: hypothetical protein JWN21_464 [Sphingomonas bacterium]|uniref:ATP-binding cassette domain-containing protein n=1 Tax=Sphingomonas bacterium TaxID=1895847 RepID=UPI00262B3171|nr:ABC transporter ATP-binding protein [Sphingomonas bacterium]MDB5694921.1 hypothetical protein [Sphingomonas bacterium]